MGIDLSDWSAFLDDSELVAYMHYVLVHPDYHGQGIAGTMVEMVKKNIKITFILSLCQRKEKMRHSMKNMVFKSWKMVWQCNYVTFQIRFNLEGIYRDK